MNTVIICEKLAEIKKIPGSFRKTSAGEIRPDKKPAESREDIRIF